MLAHTHLARFSATFLAGLLTDEDVPRYILVYRSMMSDWKVELVEDNISEFYVSFSGPKDSEYGAP